MRHRLLAAAALLTFIACSSSREVQQYTIQDMLGTTGYFGGSFSPDNAKLLVGSNESGIINAYAISLADGSKEQLTSSTTESIRPITYFPNDERFLYAADEGGNELAHIYVRELDGSVRDLTPGDGHIAGFAGWAADDQSFFVVTTERDQRFMDLYEYNATTYERTMLFENNDGYGGMLVSPDKSRIVLGKTNTNADSDMYMYDVATGRTEHLTPHDGDVQFGAQAFSPDGSTLYYTTDDGSEFRQLRRRHLESGEEVTVAAPDWDVMYASFSTQGRYLVMGVNADARNELHVMDGTTLDPVELPTVEGADVTSVSFSRDESHMRIWAADSRSPSNLYAGAVEDGELTKLTESLNPNVDRDDLVDGETIRFASYDGVEIPGVLYKPHQASPDNLAPAIVWVHGGPGGQSRIGYSGLIQYLVNHGYVVYAINNRGSSGYGKTFNHMDDQKHGEADLDDVVASKQMLIDQGYVDPNRVAVVGGSYGGYMVLAALTFRPQVFDAGVDIFGISNWHRTVNSIPPWWTAQREALQREMGPFDDEEFFRAKSPLFHAENIVKPLMVLQGANDPRVLQIESDEIVAAVRANGVPVEYIVFEDEGHGFAKKENQEVAYEGILNFLNTHLTGATDPE